MTPIKDISTEITTYIKALTDAYTADAKNTGFKIPIFAVTYNKKYARVYTEHENGVNHNVYAFIALTDDKMPLGSILKAKTWNSPELNFPRGNVNGDYEITPHIGV